MRIVLPVTVVDGNTILDDRRQIKFFCGCKNREYYPAPPGQAENIEIAANSFNFLLKESNGNAYFRMLCRRCNTDKKEQISKNNVRSVGRCFVVEA